MKQSKKSTINPHYFLYVGLTSTNQKIIKWLRNNFDGSIHIDKRKKNVCFEWRIYANCATSFFQQVLPYLRIKRAHAKLALRFQREMRKNKKHNKVTSESLRRRERFRNEMFELTHQYPRVEIKFPRETKISYVVGLFDGEGSISILLDNYRYPSQSHVLSVRLSSIEESVINWLRENFGGFVAIDTCLKHKHPSFVWGIGPKIGENFLKQILPLLRIKKPQAELACQFQRTKRQNKGRRLTPEILEQREEFRKRLITLNHGI